MIPPDGPMFSIALRNLLLWYTVTKSCCMCSVSVREIVPVCLTCLCMVQLRQNFTGLHIKHLQIEHARFGKEPVDHRMSSGMCSWDSHCKFGRGICTRLVLTLQFSELFLVLGQS